MTQQPKSVRVVLIGTPGSGKSSLIATFVQGVFPIDQPPPAVLGEITMAPDMAPLEDVGLTIVDTGGSDSVEDEAIRKAIGKADVIIITYCATDEKEFASLGPKWLDKLNFNGPVVLVGTKDDLLPESDSRDPDKRMEDLATKLQPLLDKYHVEACLECSSKNNSHVSDVFYFAQQAVVYPVSPLFEGPEMEIKPKFRFALQRVFRFFDQDHDDVLNDVELNDFLKECFKAALPQNDLDGVKSLLARESKTYVTAEGKITESGFFELFRIVSLKNRPETSWVIVRAFGFNDQLQYVLPPRMYSHLASIDRDKMVELLPRAIQFLTAVFNQYDRDCDGALNVSELHDALSVNGMFEPFGDGDPTPPAVNRLVPSLVGFPHGCHTNPAGNVTLKGWLSQWSMCAALQPATAMYWLTLLGYRDDDGIVSLSKKGMKTKSVVRIAIVGDTGVGKTSLLSALTRKWSVTTATSSPHTISMSAAAPMKPLDSMGGNLHNISSGMLILTELVPTQAMDVIKSPEFKMDFDLVILMFDASRKETVEMLDKIISTAIPSTMPCIVLCNKADLLQDDNPAMQQAKSLCELYSLNPPEAMILNPPTRLGNDALRGWSQKVDHWFQIVFTLALAPPSFVFPMTAQLKLERERDRVRRMVKRVGVVFGVASLLLGAGMYWWGWRRTGMVRHKAVREE